MARLLDAVLLFTISLVYISIVQANYKSWITRCCVKGQRKASKTKDPSACNADDLDRRRFNSPFDRLICRHSERVCCVKEIQKMSCEIGKYEASQNGSCGLFRPFVGGDNFRECCDCCALGIKAKTDDSVSCSYNLFVSLRSMKCAQAFKECCNGSVSQPNPITVPNKPKCSDNFCQQECRDIPNEGAKCYCRTGYQIQADRVSCKDIDECQFSDSLCSPLEVCVNSPGSYRCVNQTEAACKQGEEKQGGRCIDIDECLRSLHRCGSQQTCVNNDGSYTCVCRSGYEASGSSCYDKNECLTKEAQCPRYSACVNTNGSYSCQCEQGRILRNNKCDDVDECSTGQYSCPSGTRCENTDGSYKCTRITPQCPPGQELNAGGQCVVKEFDICARIQCGAGFVCDPDSPGRPCQDIDECKKVPSSCKPGETCVNFIGTFECRDPCKGVDCGKGLKCQASGRSYSCLDIDECRFAPRKCTGDHEICVNSYGDYSCKCRDQFRRNPQTQKCERTNVCTGVTCPRGYRCVIVDRSNFQCKDINECEESTAKCRTNQRCVNYPGGHYCSCQDGYRLNRLTNECEEIDECAERRSGCNQICENTPGSFVCRCREGFQMQSNGRTCRDINECSQGTSGCSHNDLCENTLGSFVCRCRRGYELLSDGRTCKDRNECSVGRRCAYRCRNMPGSYRCICPSGYNSTGYYCSDFDECEAGLKCNSDHFCFNTYGSHRCIRKLKCPTNYVNTTDRRCDRQCKANDRACYTNNKVQRISLWTFKLRSNDPPSRIFSYRIVTYGYRKRPKVNYYFHRGNVEDNFEIITQDEDNGVFAYIQNKDRIKGPKIFYLEFRGDVIDSETEQLASRFVHQMYVFVSRYDF